MYGNFQEARLSLVGSEANQKTFTTLFQGYFLSKSVLFTASLLIQTYTLFLHNKSMLLFDLRNSRHMNDLEQPNPFSLHLWLIQWIGFMITRNQFISYKLENLHTEIYCLKYMLNILHKYLAIPHQSNHEPFPESGIKLWNTSVRLWRIMRSKPSLIVIYWNEEINSTHFVII